MFFDAMIYLGVNPVKARIMYYAVYIGGPRWVALKPGRNCGELCINSLSESKIRWEGPTYDTPEFQRNFDEARQFIEANPTISIEAIEARAQSTNPGDFFFRHQSTYEPTGPGDPNILPAR